MNSIYNHENYRNNRLRLLKTLCEQCLTTKGMYLDGYQYGLPLASNYIPYLEYEIQDEQRNGEKFRTQQKDANGPMEMWKMKRDTTNPGLT